MNPLMGSSGTKKKYWQYSINIFVDEWKLNLATRGSSSKNFENPCLSQLNYDLVWFNGIPTFADYLMPNPVFTYTFDL